MPARHLRLAVARADRLRAALDKAGAELDVPGRFPVDVRDEAAGAARRLATPDSDLTDLPFVTIDPQDSMDLDQAMHLSRDGEGFLVRYAIADVAAEYVHVTAPLRRLADRYALEVCASISAGVDVPDWARAALPDLPEVMADSGRRAGAYEAACVAAVEAAVMTGREGDVFPGVVVDVATGDDRGEVVIQEPAVRGRIDGDDLPLGEDVSVRLVEAAIEARRVAFALA